MKSRSNFLRLKFQQSRIEANKARRESTQRELADKALQHKRRTKAIAGPKSRFLRIGRRWNAIQINMLKDLSRRQAWRTVPTYSTQSVAAEAVLRWGPPPRQLPRLIQWRFGDSSGWGWWFQGRLIGVT